MRIRTLCTIEQIKAAVDAGHDVRCSGGGYRVLSQGDTYYIYYEPTNYMIGLHGQQGTQYAEQLNGSDFYYDEDQS